MLVSLPASLKHETASIARDAAAVDSITWTRFPGRECFIFVFIVPQCLQSEAVWCLCRRIAKSYQRPLYPFLPEHKLNPFATMSTRPEKASTSDGGSKKHRQAPYNKNAKPKGGPGGGGGGQGNTSGVPGVSKIKSQIRQTTRLLSKVSS
jgi:hypothetical protein